MKIRILFMPTILFLCFCIISGCAFHPLGMSDSEWNVLTSEQKIEARVKHEQIKAQKLQARADREAAAKKTILTRYENAHYGDIISVTITDGTMGFRGEQREYEPIAFDLIRGELKTIKIIRKGKRNRVNNAVMRFSNDGKTFFFDDDQNNRLVLVGNAWERGKTYKIKELKNRNTNPQNITINIRYSPISGKQEQIIIIR